MRFNWALIAGFLATASPAVATTFTTTALSDIAAVTSAVVQGEVTAKKTLLDARGVPWTIYTLAVDAMFAGEFAGREFSFRIIGGPISSSRGYSLVGAPMIMVGDSIVMFYTPADDCQVMGLQFGVFWRRSNDRGEPRLVNFLDQAVASFSSRGPEFSGEIVRRSEADRNSIPDVIAPVDSQAETGAAKPTSPPAADADVALDELQAFSATFVKNPIRVQSTTDLTALPVHRRLPPRSADSATDSASGGTP
ncbi:MAG: hypothetical protein ABI895_40325 [Deltaproteobacteria bacterium]